MALPLIETRTRWRIPSVLAITVESGRVAMDHLHRENGGGRILHSLSLPWGAARVLEDPEGAGRELLQLLESANVRERRCVVCLPPGWALSTTTDLPKVAAEDLGSFLELRAEREFPLAAAELALAHSAYTLPGGESKATLAAVPLKRLEAVRRMLATAGCRALSISLALDPALADQRDPAAASLNVLVNGNHVDLIVMAGGGVVAMRSVGVGDDRGGDGAGTRGAAIGRELRITLGRLPDSLRPHVAKARFIGARGPAEALLESTQPYLHRLGLQGIVPVGRGGRSAKDGTSEPRPGAAVEAADWHLQGNPVLFEFVEREVSPLQTALRRLDTRRHRWVGIVVGLGLLLPAATLGLRSHLEGRLQAEWRAMSGEVSELEDVQSRIRQFRPWFGRSTPSVAILEGLASAFPESGDVWAKSVEVRDGVRVACAGFARSQSAWMEFLDRLRAQPGVTELQVQSVLGENPLRVSFTFVAESSHDQ